MDSASDFGSGGWGFESPQGLVDNVFCPQRFVAYPFHTTKLRDSKFGRVVKALALGASLERGMGSNPIACILFFVLLYQSRGCSSLGRAVGSQSAGTGIETPLLQNYFLCVCTSMRQWCIGNIEASQALAPGSTPGWRRFLF
jgi:hypothetical protein